MNRNAADRPNPLRKGMYLAALGAAVLLVLAGGCGNDNPYPGGMSVQVAFQGATSGTSSTMAWNPATQGPLEVKSVVVGAIVITHNRGGCPGGATLCAYSDVSQVTTTNRDLLQTDAEQSVNFLEINVITGDTAEVEFPIPPNAAGPWQLIGIGLKNDLSQDGLAEITSVDPIWYGFVPEFLNGKVVPGTLYPTPLTLQPWCSSTGGPVQPGDAGCS